MKTIYIITNDQNIADKISIEIKKESDKLDLIGFGREEEESIRFCNFNQPDFIITQNIPFDIADQILEVCPDSKLIIVSDDVNRASSIQTELEKKGNYRCDFVDINAVSPQELVKLIIDFDESSKVLKSNEKSIIDLAFEEGAENTKNIIKENDSATYQELKKKDLIEKDDVEKMLDRGLNNEKADLTNLTSKVITVFSKKGGTGTSTIAKEMSNIFSSTLLPKRISKENQYLKTVIVDLDFEHGSVRTFLGIDKPTNNIYAWINDILDKLENKIDISDVRYNSVSVMQYVKKIEETGSLYALITDQGSLPIKTLSRIVNLDSNGELLSKIINVIIVSLKKCFDIVVLDTESSLNEMSLSAINLCDNLLYVLNPTIADCENLKVFTDEILLMKEDGINLDKVSLVLNKMTKNIYLHENILEILSLIKYKAFDYEEKKEVDKNYFLCADIPYTDYVTNATNTYSFLTNNSSSNIGLYKKSILKLCSHCLPIFKVKTRTAGIKELEKKYEKKKQKKNKLKIKTEKLNKNNENPDNMVDNNYDFETINEFLMCDLSNIVYETFVDKLKSFSTVKKMDSGFPVIKKKPPLLNKKVWKFYQKQLIIELKNNKKNKSV